MHMLPPSSNKRTFSQVSGALLELCCGPGAAERARGDVIPSIIDLGSSGSVVIGRSSRQSDVVLNLKSTPNTISRTHAEVRKSGKQWAVTDLRSVNGVFVNGFKVASTHLRDKDVVQFGGAASVPFGTRFEGSHSNVCYIFREGNERGEERGIEIKKKRRLVHHPQHVGEKFLEDEFMQKKKHEALAAQNNEISTKTQTELNGKLEVIADDKFAKLKVKFRDQNVKLKEIKNSLFEKIRCGICKQPIALPAILPCSHAFCYGCWNQSGRRTCPFCKRMYTTKEDVTRRSENLEELIFHCVKRLGSTEESKEWADRLEQQQLKLDTKPELVASNIVHIAQEQKQVLPTNIGDMGVRRLVYPQQEEESSSYSDDSD